MICDGNNAKNKLDTGCDIGGGGNWNQISKEKRALITYIVVT